LPRQLLHQGRTTTALQQCHRRLQPQVLVQHPVPALVLGLHLMLLVLVVTRSLASRSRCRSALGPPRTAAC
jgi:hypothetical protein